MLNGVYIMSAILGCDQFAAALAKAKPINVTITTPSLLILGQ